MRSYQLHKRRRGWLSGATRSALETLLQLRIVQPQRMSNRIHAVFPGQFHSGLPYGLRKLRPMWPGAAKLIQPPLQLDDWLGSGGCDFLVQDQPTSAAD